MLRISITKQLDLRLYITLLCSPPYLTWLLSVKMKEEVYSYTINSEYKLPRSELTNVFAVSQRCSGDFNNASLIGKKVTLTSKTYVNSITAF